MRKFLTTVADYCQALVYGANVLAALLDDSGKHDRQLIVTLDQIFSSRTDASEAFYRLFMLVNQSENNED